MEEEEEEEENLPAGKNRNNENSFASKTKKRAYDKAKQPWLKTRDGNGHRLSTLEVGLYG